MKMLLLVVTLLAGGALLLLWLAARLRAAEARRPWPYFAKQPLTQPEQVLYFRLIDALAPEHIVLAQVQLSRMLGVRHKGREYRSWLNRIDRLSADFVVCRKDASVLVAIELDDATHRRAARRATDAKKARALRSAGIPVLRWTVAEMPDAAGIRAAMPIPDPAPRRDATRIPGARTRIEPFIGEAVVVPLQDADKSRRR